MKRTTLKRGYCARATWTENCTKANGTPLAESDVIRNEQKIVENRATIREQKTIKRNVVL